MRKTSSDFNRVLNSVETLSLEDRAALIEVVNRRLAAARRAEFVQEVAAARRAYRQGHVKPLNYNPPRDDHSANR